MMGAKGGVGWHVYHLMHAMGHVQSDLELVGYIAPGTFDPKDLGDTLHGIQWVEAGKFGMKLRGRTDDLDLYHGTNFRMHTRGRFGAMVTIHDLWLERHPEYSPKLFGQWLSSRKTKRIASTVEKIVTVSHFSATEISALYGRPIDQIAVVHNGVSKDFYAVDDRLLCQRMLSGLGVGGRPYFLFVGGADPRKNHGALLEAFKLFSRELNGYHVVLVGDSVHRFGDMLATARRLGIEGAVQCLGRVSQEQMRVLYSCAQAFVFPSLYEGFGMPILEAMACETPVITSNRSALPEVAGEAALLIDPENPAEIGKAMCELSNAGSRRNALIQEGKARIRRFTWEKAAQQTVGLYKALCA
jgi:glycosyltransferase involved in cell wall biosynthesis